MAGVLEFKPPNQNPEHKAAHVLVMGCTGSGKSQLLKSGLIVPRDRDARVIGYDDVGSLPGLYYSSRRGFLAALKAAQRKGGGFRIFYGGTQTSADHEWWCSVLWSQLDGNHITYGVTEELAAVCLHAGEAEPELARCMNQGRKYGLRFVSLTQRPQEIYKTVYSQSVVKFVGQQSEENVKKAARVAGVSEEQIEQLEPLQFYKNEGRAGAGELVQITASAPVGVIWKD